MLGIIAKGQYLRPVLGHRDRVLEVRCELTICRDDCPAVARESALSGCRCVIIGSSASTKPGRSSIPVPAIAVVRYLRLLVHRPADAVPDQLADDSKTVALGMRLHRGADVPDVVSRAASARSRSSGTPASLRAGAGVLRDVADRQRLPRCR